MATFDSGKNDEKTELLKAVSADVTHDAFYAVIQSLIAQDEVGPVISLLETRVRSVQDDRRAWILLSRIVEQVESPKRARRIVRKALKVEPDVADYGLRLSELYLVENRIDDAIKVLKRLARHSGDARLTQRLGELVETRFPDLADGHPVAKTESINLNENTFSEPIDADQTIQSARLLVEERRPKPQSSDPNFEAKVSDDFDRTVEGQVSWQALSKPAHRIETFAQLVQMDERERALDKKRTAPPRERGTTADAESTDKPIARPPIGRATQDEQRPEFASADESSEAEHHDQTIQKLTDDLEPAAKADGHNRQTVDVNHLSDANTPPNETDDETTQLPGLAQLLGGLNEHKNEVTIDAVVRPWAGSSSAADEGGLDAAARKTQQLNIMSSTGQTIGDGQTPLDTDVESEKGGAEARAESKPTKPPKAPIVGDEPTETTGTPAAILGMEIEQLNEGGKNQFGTQEHPSEIGSGAGIDDSHLTDSAPHTERLARARLIQGVERVRYGDPGEVDIPEASSMSMEAPTSSNTPLESVIISMETEDRPVQPNRPPPITPPVRPAQKGHDQSAPTGGTVGDRGKVPVARPISDDAPTINRGQAAADAVNQQRRARHVPPVRHKDHAPDAQPNKRVAAVKRNDGVGKVSESPSPGLHRPIRLEDDIATNDVRGHGDWRDSQKPMENERRDGSNPRQPQRPLLGPPPALNNQLGAASSSEYDAPNHERTSLKGWPAASPMISLPPGQQVDPKSTAKSSSISWRMMAIVMIAAVSVVAVAGILSYAHYVSETKARLKTVRDQLKDGNFGSRLALSQQASGLHDASQFTLFGERLNRLIFPSDDFVPTSAYDWLRARNLSELVALYEYQPAQIPLSKFLSGAPTGATGDDALVARVLSHVSKGEYEEAEKLLQEAIKKNASSADMYWAMALVEQHQGRLADALKHIETAVELDPDHPHALPLQIELMAQAPGVDPTLALKSFRRLTEEQRPEHIGARIGFETQQIMTGKRPKEAVQRLRTILGLPSDLVSPYHRATILLALGHHHLLNINFAAAREAFTEAVQLVPGRKNFVVPLVLLDLRGFRVEEAQRALVDFKDDQGVDILELRAAIDLLRGRFAAVRKRLATHQTKSPRLDYFRGVAILDQRETVGGKSANRVADAIAARNAFGEALEQSVGWVAPKLQKLRAEGIAGIDGENALASLKSSRRAMPLHNSWDAVIGQRALSFRAYGDLLFARGDVKRAAAQYVNAFEIDERDYRAAWALCRLHTEKRRPRRAINWCKKALVNPSFDPARQHLLKVAAAYGDLGAVIDGIEGWQRSRRPLTADALRTLGYAYHALNRHDKLRALADAKLEGVDAATHGFLRGLILLKDGRKIAAETELAKASQAHPADENVQVTYAQLLLSRGRIDKAISVLKSSSERGGHSRTALLLARAALEAGKVQKALEYARRSRKLAAQELSHPRLRAEAMAVEARAFLYKGGRNAAQQAGRLILKALRIEPDLPAGLLARGMLAESRAQYDKALRLFGRLVEVEPTSPEGLFRFGRLLLREARDQGLARRVLRDVQRLDPEGRWGERAGRLLQ